MQVALGVLGWRPADFWSAGMAEFVAAYDGWLESHGVSRGDDPMTRDDLAALMQQYPD